MLRIKADRMGELEGFRFARMDNKVFFSDMFHGWRYEIRGKHSSSIISVHDKDSVASYREICAGGEDRMPMFGIGACDFNGIAKVLYDLIKADMVEEV